MKKIDISSKAEASSSKAEASEINKVSSDQVETSPEPIQEPSDFEAQNAEEKIILLLKRHPMTLYPTGLKLVAVGLLGVGFITIFGASTYTSIAFLILIIVGGYFGFTKWYLWWSSHYILTNQRAISVDQKGFFHRSVSEASLDMIVNVSFEVKGPYQTFLDYGTVSIITSGKGEADAEFTCIPHPYDVQQKITETVRENSLVLSTSKQNLQ